MKRIIKTAYLFILILMTSLEACTKAPEKAIELVDPMIGTDGIGHTFPGATTPFGMIQLSPSNDLKGWNWCSGYHYSDSILKGFAHTHISGAGLTGLGDILLMPTTGQIHIDAGTEKNPESGYRSHFSHQNETASPGYYSVLLDDYQIKVELTASPRVGFHRYTFLNANMGNVIIDPTHGLGESILKTAVEFISDTEIRGYKHCTGDAGTRTAYFYAKFSQPFEKYGIVENNLVSDSTIKAVGRNVKAFVTFDMKIGKTIEAKVALSFVSYKGAKLNFDAEAKNIDFEKALTLAQGKWEEKLNKFQVKGINKTDERIFYTGVYHSFISPNLISDVDGNYIVEGKQYHSNEPHYSTFSTWDTYRALHPLFCIVEHKATKDFVNTLVSRHTVQKVELPVWELLGYDNKCMINYNTVSPMVDAILKDVAGIDVDGVYSAVTTIANDTTLEKSSIVYGVNGMKQYVKLHYVPAEVNSSVAKTAEKNYTDWNIARLAEKLDKNEDVEYYKARSLGYRNLFHPERKLLWPKYSNDSWRHMDTTTWYDYEMNYISGNVWGYTTYVPHDMEGLVKLIGGREIFASWLDKIFADTTSLGGEQHVDISGFIGKYGHGDEPSHHMPYLYNRAAQPWKGQTLVRQVMDEFYSDQPDGLINNEDLGQMSAWYIFSAMGFYPVNPGSLIYEIGSPKLKEAILNLENDNIFKIIAHKNNSKNMYIQSVKLNGKPHNKTFITHQQIMNGGVLKFVMGSKPNKEWGATEYAISPSFVELKDKSKLANSTATPYDVNGVYVFENEIKVTLTCETPDTEIYYTLDGSQPGTKSHKYTRPFTLNKTTRVKAIALSKKKSSGLLMDQIYYKGIDLSSNNQEVKIKIVSEPDVRGDKAGKHLFDGMLSTSYHADKNWTVWQNNKAEILFELREKRDISSVTVSYLDHTIMWVFPPKAIQIYISDDGLNFKLLTENTSIESKPTFNPEIKRLAIQFRKTNVKYLKVEIEPYGKIPKWHKGSGKPAKLYVGEIIIN